MSKHSVGITFSDKFSMEVDPELDKQMLKKGKSYESLRTPGYLVVISELEDSYVVFYDKNATDKEAQQAPCHLFKQLYKEVI